MPEKCPQCGGPLPAGGLAGLCPSCLLKQGAAADTATRAEAKPFVPPAVEEVAQLFPQLEVLGFLGKGGMGAVYKARQPALDRLVALKILPAQAAPDPGFAERFSREARALARLSHPNIVAVFEFGQVSADLPYFIMEFVDGVNLRQLQKAGRLSPREALQIVPQICDALQYAHDEGVVHRDIKPENILVDRKGRVKIADFGLAKIMKGGDASPGSPGDEERTAGPAVPTHLTEAGQVMGTPHYMAPEQVEHPLAVDHRADIFSLGVVFYEMLTGELPLGKFQPPSAKVRVDVRLDEVVLHALEKEPERRYQQASQVKTDVQKIVGGAAAPGQPIRQPDQAVRRKRINCVPALSLYCLTIALFMAIDVVAVGGLTELAALLPWAILSWVIGGVSWSILHYSCWKALPKKYRATTPARALGFLFIPLFNCYWAFVTFPKLASGFNALKGDRPELAIRNLRGVGFAYAVSTVLVFTLGFVPGWGALVLLADLVLTFEFYLGVAANANLLVEGPEPIGTLAMLPSTRDELVPEAEGVRRRLRLASAALFIAGGLCLGEFVLLGTVMAVLPMNGARSMMAFIQSLQTGFLGGLDRFKWQTGLGLGNLGPLVGAMTLVCAWQIQRLQGLALAITASVLSILLGLWMFPVGLLLGPGMVPLGTVALMILCQGKVRAAFEAQAELEASRGGGVADVRVGYRLALISAVLAVLSVAITPLYGMTVPGGSGLSGSAAIVVAVIYWLHVSGSQAAVMLGWLGLWTMRRSPLSSKGVGFAVFGISLAPILQLCRLLHPGAGLFWLQQEQEGGQISTNMLFALVVSCLLAWGISAWKSRLNKHTPTASGFMPRLCWNMGILALAYAGILLLRIPTMTPASWPGTEASSRFYLNHQHVNREPESSPNRFAGHTPFGILEILEVSDPEQPRWTCWLPDGTPSCPQSPRRLAPKLASQKARAMPLARSFAHTQDDKGSREVIFYLGGSGDVTTNLDRLHFECYVTNRGAEQLCADYRCECYDQKIYHATVARVPAEATAACVRLGVLAGRWEDTDAAWACAGDPRKLKPKSIRHAGEDWEVGIWDIEPTAAGLSVTFNCTLKWNGTPRLVAVDAEGKVHEPIGPSGESFPGLAAPREAVGARVVSNLTFPGMDAIQLRELRLQIEPYLWTEFRNVSLQPDRQTQVEIVDPVAK
jgi:predicted Ser/Thr protein kinase